MQTNKVHTMKKPATKRSLASSDAGLSGIADYDPKIAIVTQAASKSTDLILWLIKGVIIVGGAYYAYGLYTNRFKNKKEVKNYPLANISLDQAKSKADAIYNAKSFFGVGNEQYNITTQQLAGLNYNALIRVYNAFGKRTSYLFSGDMDLIEFFQDQFNTDHLSELSSLTFGVYF